MSKWQPRIGAAWDITGDAKNIVRANWGYFMSPNALTLPSFARTGTAPRRPGLSCSLAYGLDAEACAAIRRSTAAASGASIPKAGIPTAGSSTPWNVFGSAPNAIDPNLKAMYTETFSLAYEREVGRRASVTVTYIDKTDQRHLRGHLRRQRRSRRPEC